MVSQASSQGGEPHDRPAEDVMWSMCMIPGVGRGQVRIVFCAPDSVNPLTPSVCCSVMAWSNICSLLQRGMHAGDKISRNAP